MRKEKIFCSETHSTH